MQVTIPVMSKAVFELKEQINEIINSRDLHVLHVRKYSNDTTYYDVAVVYRPLYGNQLIHYRLDKFYLEINRLEEWVKDNIVNPLRLCFQQVVDWKINVLPELKERIEQLNDYDPKVYIWSYILPDGYHDINFFFDIYYRKPVIDQDTTKYKHYTDYISYKKGKETELKWNTLELLEDYTPSVYNVEPVHPTVLLEKLENELSIFEGVFNHGDDR